ncbi:hypothetical protein COO91_08388 [Nostoc flagelliforme CCNUN1]|uniref:Uncharacterized protein n=1 Tax=Nostoc flagelliforme CCNUN1 TaxID=2038116 RepID=A0A2K8T3M6_9NOSO|nr:hypothetical protein COO91_08388 [Nostoc flagelliforme CCNUN1]
MARLQSPKLLFCHGLTATLLFNGTQQLIPKDPKNRENNAFSLCHGNFIL